MSSQIKWALGILLAAVGIAALMIWIRPTPEQEERVAEIPLVKGLPLKAASGTIPVIVSGTVQPRDQVVIGAQVSGRLTYVSPAFREGSIVPAGVVVVRIDAADYQNQVRMAQADVAAQDVAVLEAREEVKIARDDLERYSRREAGQNSLATTIDKDDYAARILPPASLEKSAKSNRAATSASGSASGSASVLATREPQLRSAQAAKQRASASLADARLALSRTRITSPFGGLVLEESAAVGTLVQVGQSLGSIASTSAYEVRLSLTQDEAALIPGLLNGSGGNIRADVFYEYGGLTYRWPAFVDRADASLDAATRNVEVFLRVPSPLRGGRLSDAEQDSSVARAPPLLLGAFVRAEIAGASVDSYAAIPAEALRPGNEIWVVRDDKLRILPVRVLQRSDTLAYVTMPSIEQGGSIVTSNMTTPTDGMPVRIARSPDQ